MFRIGVLLSGSDFFPESGSDFFPESGSDCFPESGSDFFLCPDQTFSWVRIRLFSWVRIRMFSWVRIRLFPESGSDFFPESGSAKNARKLKVHVKKCISFLAFSTLSFLVWFLQNLIKDHHLDPFSLLINLNLMMYSACYGRPGKRAKGNKRTPNFSRRKRGRESDRGQREKRG